MRVGLVNDLPMAVELLRRVIASTAEHEVAWIAMNGREAVEAPPADGDARELPAVPRIGGPGGEGGHFGRRQAPVAADHPFGGLLGNVGENFSGTSHGRR